MQILAFIVSMTGTVMLLYRDPDISPQIWNCSLILASVSAAALFKVTAYCVVAVRPLLGHLRFVLAVLVCHDRAL